MAASLEHGARRRRLDGGLTGDVELYLDLFIFKLRPREKKEANRIRINCFRRRRR